MPQDTHAGKMKRIVSVSYTDIPDTYDRVDGDRVDAEFICINDPTNHGFYIPPSKERVDAHIAVITDWAARLNQPRTHCSRSESLPSVGASFAEYWATTLPEASAQMQAFGKWATWIMIVDDILDADLKSLQVDNCGNQNNNNHSTVNKKNGAGHGYACTQAYANLSKDLDMFVDIVDGKLDVRSTFGVLRQKSGLKHLKVLALGLQNVTDSLRDAIPGYDKEKQHYVPGMREFFHSHLWIFGRTEPRMSLESFIYFRSHHSTTLVTFEILALLHGIQWTSTPELRALRNDVEFVNWKHAYGRCMAIGNDVIGLRKELLHGEVENLPIQKVLVEGIPLAQAIQESIRFVNLEAKEVQVVGERLVKRYGGSPIQKLVQTICLSVDGHLYWYKYRSRYGQMTVEPKYVMENEYNSILYRNPQRRI